MLWIVNPPIDGISPLFEKSWDLFCLDPHKTAVNPPSAQDPTFKAEVPSFVIASSSQSFGGNRDNVSPRVECRGEPDWSWSASGRVLIEVWLRKLVAR